MYPQQGQDPYYQQSPADLEYHPMAMGLKRPSKAPWVMMLLMMGVGGAGGYWLWNDRARALAQLKTASADAAGKKELEEKVKALESEKGELTTARDSLQKTVEEKSSELAELKGTYDKLNEKMKDEIATGDISLSADGGRLRVGLVDKILFESGDSRISKRGEGVLERVGAVLATIEDKQIQVSGHTDKEPISDKLKAQYPTNWELSVSRATNVVRFLEERAKVPAGNMVASGYGEHHPIASNKSAKGKARNRRIEILLTPSLAPKAISKTKLKERQEAKVAKAGDEKGKPAAEKKK